MRLTIPAHPNTFCIHFTRTHAHTHTHTHTRAHTHAHTHTHHTQEGTDLRKYWMPDKACKDCSDCGVKFSLFIRRHHCRICGRIYCNNCCSLTIPAAELRPNLQVSHTDSEYLFKRILMSSIDNGHADATVLYIYFIQ